MFKITFGNVVVDSNNADIKRMVFFKDINNMNVSIMFKSLSTSLGFVGEQQTLKIEDTVSGLVLIEKPAELINVEIYLDNSDMPYLYRFKIL